MTSSSAEDCCKSCVNHPAVLCCVNTFRWVPVVFIVAVIVWSYYAYVIELCILTIDSYVEKSLYILLYHVFLVLFLWSYYQTIFAKIGAPKQNFVLSPEIVEELNNAARPSDHRLILDKFVRDQHLPVAMRAFDGAIRYCEKCQCIKPDRCHHCSVCGQCVLKFDHHCPWVNTCVNYGNYKFFIQFLGYSLVLCIYVFLTDIQYFIWFWRDGLKEGASKFHIMFMFFVSGMFAISVSALFFYHLWLTGKNRSTIESFRAPVFTYGPDANGFNLGWRENCKQVFGTSKLLWFLPIFSSRGDGCAYETRTPPPVSRGEIQQNQEMSGSDAQRGGNSNGQVNMGNSSDVDGRGSPNKAFRLDETRNRGEPSAKTPPTGSESMQNSGNYFRNDNFTGAYQSLGSRGDGLVYPMPMLDPEADTLLNTRHPKWEDEDSASSDYDNNHVPFTTTRQPQETYAMYSSANGRSVLREYNGFDHSYDIPMTNVPVVVTQS